MFSRANLLLLVAQNHLTTFELLLKHPFLVKRCLSLTVSDTVYSEKTLCNIGILSIKRI